MTRTWESWSWRAHNWDLRRLHAGGDFDWGCWLFQAVILYIVL